MSKWISLENMHKESWHKYKNVYIVLLYKLQLPILKKCSIFVPKQLMPTVSIMILIKTVKSVSLLSNSSEILLQINFIIFVEI